jgi:hypothetical protein
MNPGELLPTNKLTRAEFVLKPNQTARMGANAGSIVVEQGPSLYQHLVETEELTLNDARIWKAFIERREGRMWTYTGWDLFYIQPQSRALGTADGAIGLTVDTENFSLTLTGVGAYKARIGDMISYRTLNNGFWVGRVQVDVDAADDEIELIVTPRPVAAHATTPAVRRVQALGEFEITTDLSGFEPYSGRKLSFTGQQVTRD